MNTNDFNVLVSLLGGLVLALSLGSSWLSRGPLSPTVIGLAAGVAIGPHGFGWFDLEAMGDRASSLEKLARLALGVGLVGWRYGFPLHSRARIGAKC